MKKLKARQVHTDEHQTVIVVESFACRYETGDNLIGLFGWSEPVAIVTSSSHGSQAVDTSGRPLSLDRLLRDVDDLGALMER